MNERKEKLLKHTLWLAGSTMCIYLARIEDASGDALAILQRPYTTYQQVIFATLDREIELAIESLRDTVQIFEYLLAATERFELLDVVHRIRSLRRPDMSDERTVETLKAEATSIRTALEAVKWRDDA